MKEIDLDNAQRNLSAIVDDAAAGEATTITRCGKPMAVVLGLTEWKRLSSAPSFGRLLMSAPADLDSERSASRMRKTAF